MIIHDRQFATQPDLPRGSCRWRLGGRVPPTTSARAPVAAPARDAGRWRARPENSMTKRMLIDASHPEETRVVVLDGSKVEEFDFEAATKRPLKGNIYLAKVTRVEPSLQAAFVEYGGNRQGFLAFSEIHPDYYQIPVADRQALLAEQEAEARRRQEDDIESFEITGAKPEDGRGRGRAEDEAEDERRRGDSAEMAPLDAAAETPAPPTEDAEPSADEATTPKTTMTKSSSIMAAPRSSMTTMTTDADQAGSRRRRRMSRLRRRSGNRRRRSGRGE